MKTVGELIQACKSGKKPVLKVIGYVWYEFELDEGCLLRVTGYHGQDHGVHHFQYNFNEFKGYNRKLLQPTWNLSNGLTGTAEQFGAWDNQNTGLFLGEYTTDLLSKVGLELHTDQLNKAIIEDEIARLEKELEEQRQLLASLPQESL